MSTETYPTLDDWEARYTPVLPPGFDPMRDAVAMDFVFGKHEYWDWVVQQDLNHVWTYIIDEGEDDGYEWQAFSLAPGIHRVNSYGFVVTEQSHEGDDNTYTDHEVEDEVSAAERREYERLDRLENDGAYDDDVPIYD